LEQPLRPSSIGSGKDDSDHDSGADGLDSGRSHTFNRYPYDKGYRVEPSIGTYKRRLNSVKILLR
jgi:hypothetical protein